MGVDYYNCEICDNIFHDAGHYGYCGNCEASLCGRCYDRMSEKNGELPEDHENYGDYGEDSPSCCDKCDGTVLDKTAFLLFLADKLGQTVEELEAEFRARKEKAE